MVWRSHDLPSGGCGSPVIANGRVYVYIQQRDAMKDTVVCLDEKTGTEYWERDFAFPKVSMHEASGTPCVAEGRCLVNGTMACYCLDAATGDLIWAKNPGVDAEVCSSFALVAGVAVVLGGEAHGYDLRTGALLWKASDPGGWARGISSAVECPGDRIIYGGKYRLCCLEARTGKVVWELPGGGKGFSDYGLTPLVSGDLLIALSRGELRGFGLSSEKPEELWHIPYGEEDSTPAADSNFVYLVNPGFIHLDGDGARATGHKSQFTIRCCELKSGKAVWETRIGQCEYSSPVVVNRRVFALTDNAAGIAMLDARDGRVLGTADVGAVRWTSPARSDRGGARVR